ncbi:YceI family protein [Marinilongibacter aquaticus]|uniref:YceI family protein n=1 Tax=Marinilongibacter aquaticus TaxID=2975157 RepID=UPI0021BCFBA2|nr:YceI family protein [Marinilongibacter aquaticus]UBM57886.1 YceI family protein [Marinilongibacter aquaticus]
MASRLLKIALLFFVTQSLSAQQWTPVSGSVNFQVKMLVSNVKGKLTGMAAKIEFEQDEPKSIYATVKTNTVNTENSLRDRHLKEKEDFFEVEKYPLIAMRSGNITKTAKGYRSDFDITLKNVTKKQSVDFRFEQNETSGTFSADFTLDRTHWNFGGNTLGMADEVKVHITLKMKKQ